MRVEVAYGLLNLIEAWFRCYYLTQEGDGHWKATVETRLQRTDSLDAAGGRVRGTWENRGFKEVFSFGIARVFSFLRRSFQCHLSPSDSFMFYRSVTF